MYCWQLYRICLEIREFRINDRLNEWKVLCPFGHKTGHFRDVLPSQSLDIVLKKLKLTKRKQTTQEQNGHCTPVIHNGSDNFTSYPPDNHHRPDDVCWRGGGLESMINNPVNRSQAAVPGCSHEWHESLIASHPFFIHCKGMDIGPPKTVADPGLSKGRTEDLQRRIMSNGPMEEGWKKYFEYTLANRSVMFFCTVSTKTRKNTLTV